MSNICLKTDLTVLVTLVNYQSVLGMAFSLDPKLGFLCSCQWSSHILGRDWKQISKERVDTLVADDTSNIIGKPNKCHANRLCLLTAVSFYR